MKKTKPGPKRGTKFSDVKRTLVGERLFMTRRTRGFSQEELGKMVGISKRMIAHYESKESDPTIETLKKLATALNVTVSYILAESTTKAIKSDINPSLRKHIKVLQELPPKEQKTILNIIDMAANKNGNG
jgi:transcriptional regulator with XRE-family HTH domain